MSLKYKGNVAYDIALFEDRTAVRGNRVLKLPRSKLRKDLVKLKKTYSYRLRAEGFVEGTNKYEGMLGSILCMYKDNYLQVGSGFTDAQRWEIWMNQDKYQDMLFEVESFGESTNKQGLTSLNCPIFKRWIEADSKKLFIE